jgi:hypothetical protein
MVDFEGMTDNSNGVIQKTFAVRGDVSYLRKGQVTPIVIKGVFDRSYLAVDPETQAIVQSTQPVCLVRLSDLPALPGEGDKVTIKSVEYKVVASEVDGYGNSLLRLHKI